MRISRDHGLSKRLQIVFNSGIEAFTPPGINSFPISSFVQRNSVYKLWSVMLIASLQNICSLKYDKLIFLFTFQRIKITYQLVRI